MAATLGLSSVPRPDPGLQAQLVVAEHAAVETANAVARTLISGGHGHSGMVSGFSTLSKAVSTLDAALVPGFRYTAVYPARIDARLAADAIPAILASAPQPSEIKERSRLVQSAATADSIPSDASVDAFNSTTAKLVTHFDALLR